MTRRGSGTAGTPRAAGAAGRTPGVRVELDDLVALRPYARGFSFLPRQPVHSLLAGRHASRLRGRGLDFDEIRRYQPGDDVRQIDWKVTARTRVTHSRVYTEERERTTILVVDQRASMFFGSVARMKSVTAAEVAALAAWRVLEQHDRVGALVFDDRGVREVRPARSSAAVMRILKEVVDRNRALSIEAAPDAAPGMLDEALRRCDRLVRHDALVCLVTDGTGQGEETRRLLTRIVAHNDVLVAFVHDPLEVALPDAGRRVFGDGRRQLEVDTSDPALRERYRAAFAAQRADGRRYLLRREVPILPLSTAEDVPSQVRRLLGRRR